MKQIKELKIRKADGEMDVEKNTKPEYWRSLDQLAETAEFESFTPYLYGTYEQSCEANPTNKKKVIILIIFVIKYPLITKKTSTPTYPPLNVTIPA